VERIEKGRGKGAEKGDIQAAAISENFSQFKRNAPRIERKGVGKHYLETT